MKFPTMIQVAAFAAVTAVNAEVIPQNFQACVPEGEYDPAFDYFPEKFVPQESFYRGPPRDFFDGNMFVLDNTTDLLEISYHKSYKIITNRFQNKSYLLYQCGTIPPPQELDGRHHLVLPIPHQGGVAITETTQIPPMELLGLRREITAYFGDPSFVTSPCLSYMMDTEESVAIYFDPNDPYNSTVTTAMKQGFVNENPQAIILEGPYGDKEGSRALSVAASQERTNVATFDWIGLYAALFNLEGAANKIASETLQRYECSSSNAASLSADLPASKRPSVLWAHYYEGYGWSVAQCNTWQDTYYCEYAKHCGAEIISRPDDVGFLVFGSFWYLNDTDVLELGKDADVWVYPSPNWNFVAQNKSSLVQQFKSVRNQQVYDTQGQGSNAWFEQRLAEYEVVALDFCDIVGNSNPTGPLHVRRWLRNVFSESVGTLDSCQAPDEINEPYTPRSAECVPLAVEENTNGSSEKSGVARFWVSQIWFETAVVTATVWLLS